MADQVVVVDEFDLSLEKIIDKSKLSRYDNWVILVEKFFSFATSVYAIILVALTILMHDTVKLPDIYNIVLAIFGVAVTFSIGIAYRYAIAEGNIRLRIQIVIFGVLCFLFGLPSVFLMTLQVLTQPSNLLFWQINLVIGLWFFAVFSWGVLLGKILVDQVSKKLEVMLLEHVKPFHEVIGHTFTNNVFRQRTIAFSLCIFFASFVWVLLNPETWFMPILYGGYVVVVHFIRSQPDFERNYYSLDSVLDLATFALRVSSMLRDFGIRRYRVHHKQRAFSGYVSVFTTEIFPDDYPPVMVIYPSIQGLNVEAIQTQINENWNTELQGRVVGPYECPFRPFEGRILVDSTVFNADKILWWGPDHRIAITIEGTEVREVQNLISGDFS